MAILSKLAKPFVYKEDVKVVPKDVVWVIIHSSVRKIPAKLFAKCIWLERLDIQGGLERIGNNGFCGCKSLKLVRLPDTVRVIGAGAFSQCSALICVVLNDGLEEIGNNSFSYCLSLEFFALSLTVRLLGVSACEGCQSLEAVGLNEGLDCVQHFAFNGCDNLKKIGIPSSMGHLGKCAIPEPVEREYKKADELWTTIRDKVIQQADGIQKEFPKSFAPAISTGKPIIEAQAKTPSTNDDSGKMKAVPKKSAVVDDTKDVACSGSLQSQNNELSPRDKKGNLKEPPKADGTSLKEACTKKMDNAFMKPTPLDGSGDVTVGLKADQVETKKLKNAVSLRTCAEGREKEMDLSGKINAERKCEESKMTTIPPRRSMRLDHPPYSKWREPRKWLTAKARMKARDGETKAHQPVSQNQIDDLGKEMKKKAAFKPTAASGPKISLCRPWEERLQTLEAMIQARDGETKTQLLVFRDQIHDLKEDMKKKDESKDLGLAEKLDKVSSGLRDLEKGLKNVQDNTEARYSETQASFRTIEQQNDQWKSEIRNQSHTIQNAALAYQRLNGNVLGLDCRMNEGMNAVNNRIEMHHKEYQAGLQLAKKEQSDLKTLVAQQAEIVSKSTMDSQKLVADVQKLDGCLMHLDKKTMAITREQHVISGEQQLARKEHADSQANFGNQMGKMGAELKKIGSDFVELECRMKNLENIAAETQGMKPKVDGLTANVTTLSHTMKDHVRASDGKFEEMATDLENQERSLEVLARVAEFKLEKERQEILEAPMVPDVSDLASGNKRHRDEIDGASQSGGMAGSLFQWTKSLLPGKKKMKGGDE